MADNKWKYEANENVEDFALQVPMPYGHAVPIEYLRVDISRETLGVITCPSGKEIAVIEDM